MPFGVADIHDMPATNMFILQGMGRSFLCGMNEKHMETQETRY